MNTDRLARLAAQFIDTIEREYADCHDAELGHAVICAEVLRTDAEGVNVSEVGTASTTGDRDIQLELLERAEILVVDDTIPMQEGADPKSQGDE